MPVFSVHASALCANPCCLYMPVLSLHTCAFFVYCCALYTPVLSLLVLSASALFACQTCRSKHMALLEHWRMTPWAGRHVQQSSRVLPSTESVLTEFLGT